ncbi:MAG: hypothetical protein OIF51_08890 [Cellvibrionaceae bacterium]|nr:hypothetical protein [Cellvibrionaceae bacterium]
MFNFSSLPTTASHLLHMADKLKSNPNIVVPILALLATVCFTAGILGVKGKLFPAALGFFYERVQSEKIRAFVFGVSTSAIGMIFAGVAFHKAALIAGPMMAAFGVVGNVWAGVYMDDKKTWDLTMFIVALVIVVLAAFLAYLSTPTNQ